MEIDIKQIVFQIVNFTILLVVLQKFMYKPILKILEARSKKIQRGLEAAEKSLEEQAKAQEKHKQLLTKAEKEAAAILDQARLEAKQAGKDIITAAKTEARESVAKEYKILSAKLNEEEQKIRNNLAAIITQATQKVLQGSLTEKAQKQIIKKQIQSLTI